MQTKKFIKNDQGFVCAVCGRTVLPMGRSSRDHCPFCLSSVHVDVNPGDRTNLCRGIMRPIAAEPDPKKGYVIFYRCEKCGALHKNRAAMDAIQQPDDRTLLIQLTAYPHEPI